MTDRTTNLVSESSLVGHQTDAIGVRDVDSEGPGKLVDKTRGPGKKTDDSVKRTTDVDLLNAVKGIDVSTVLRKEPSTFVPNAHVLYYVLSQMDDLMTMNRTWNSKEVRWCPLLSRIYVGILFYIQTFRVMRTAGIASSEVKQILRDFESEFDYSNVPIPGPLVPFFKALSASQPPYEEYGVVSPIIPRDIGCTDATGHALREPLCYLLPNLAGLFNSYANILRVDQGNALPWDYNFSTPTGAAAPVAYNGATLQLQVASISPGTVYPLVWNQRKRNDFQRSLTRIRGIPSIAGNAGEVSLTDLIGLSDNPRWFGELTGIMTMYCQYFQGSTSLSTCSTLDGPCAQFICVGTDDYPDRTTHITGLADERIGFYARAESSRIDDSPPSSAYSLLTQINWRPPLNFGHTDDNIGTVGSTLTGPWWNVAPLRSQSQRYSPTVGIPEVIADKYYMDKPSMKN